MQSISFTYNFQNFYLENEKKIEHWLKSVLDCFKKRIAVVDIFFVTDEKLLELNQEVFKHDYYTDIITLDYSFEATCCIEMYISVDRTKDNSYRINEKLEDEFLRLLSHGILHVMGFKDKTEEDKKRMREEEDKLISMFHVEQN